MNTIFTGNAYIAEAVVMWQCGSIELSKHSIHVLMVQLSVTKFRLSSELIRLYSNCMQLYTVLALKSGFNKY